MQTSATLLRQHAHSRVWWLLPLLVVGVWWLGYAGDANGVWPWRHEMLLLTGLLVATKVRV